MASSIHPPLSQNPPESHLISSRKVSRFAQSQSHQLSPALHSINAGATMFRFVSFFSPSSASIPIPRERARLSAQGRNVTNIRDSNPHFEECYVSPTPSWRRFSQHRRRVDDNLPQLTTSGLSGVLQGLYICTSKTRRGSNGAGCRRLKNSWIGSRAGHRAHGSVYTCTCTYKTTSTPMLFHVPWVL